jgi:hypothetical protein
MEFSGADDWKFIGLKDRYNKFIHLSIVEANCKFKNGKGMYYLVDNDHGTWRVWGDRIVGFRFVENNA